MSTVFRDKPVRICHLTSNHSQKDDRIFYKQCVGLARSGFDVHLVAFGQSEESGGVHIHGIGEAPVSRTQRMFTGLTRIYEKAIGIQAEIYQIHDPILLICALKLKKCGKIVIFDSHENYYAQFEEKKYLPAFLRKAAARIYQRVETYVVQRIDAVLVPCTFEDRNIFEGRAARTEFIPNYPIKGEFYDKFKEDDEKNGYICYVGGLSPDRGITQLVCAAAEAQVPLVLAGSFVSDEYERTLRSLPEFSNVDFRGFLSRAEVCEVYRHAAAGVCTLLRNGQYDKLDTFGVKVFEYMAMGLPVILTDYPYARRVFEKYKFGIRVDPENIQEIAEAVQKLASDELLRVRMGREGRRAVADVFCWDRVLVKLVGLYHDLLAPKDKEGTKSAS